MTNEEVKKLREEYRSLLGCKKEILGYIKRKEELEQTPEVREYFKLCDIIASGEGYSFYGVEKLTNDQIIDRVIDGFNSEEDNNIYTYMGEDIEKNITTFKNIETFVIKNIKNEDISNFEKENIVMYPSKNVTADKFFNDARKEYYRVIVNNYSDKYAKENAIRKSNIFSRKQRNSKIN